MLRLSTPFERVKNWLLSSGLFISNPSDKNCGAVYSFYDENKKEFCFLYPEITGYFVSTLTFLYDVEKNEKYLTYAKLSADWLISLFEKYGGIIQGIFPDSTKKLVYSFDTGVCAKGLLDYYSVTKQEKYLNYAKKMLSILVDEAVEKDGTIKPFKNLKNNQYEENTKVWYNQKGCLHIKMAMPILILYKITKNEELLDTAKRICNTYQEFQNRDGSFLISKGERAINLHTLCYALEGLLYAFSVTGNKEYLTSCIKGVNWSMEHIERDGSIDLWHNSKYHSRAVYPVSQLIRIMILLGSLKNKNYKSHIEKLRSFLVSQQASNPSPQTFGGFYEEIFKSFLGWKKRLKINSWTSMFALQALYWHDNLDKITFEKAIDSLY